MLSLSLARQPRAAEVLAIEKEARKQHVDLGGWRASRLSCLGTRFPLRERLEEVRPAAAQQRKLLKFRKNLAEFREK